MATRARPPLGRITPGGTDAPRRCRGDRGSASTELVIVMPLLLLLVLASVHVGLWFHARHLVNAAAQEGARAARATGANDDDGYHRADQMLRDLGSGSVTDPIVTVTRNADTVTAAWLSPRSGTVSASATPALSTTASRPVTAPHEWSSRTSR